MNTDSMRENKRPAEKSKKEQEKKIDRRQTERKLRKKESKKEIKKLEHLFRVPSNPHSPTVQSYTGRNIYASH